MARIKCPECGRQRIIMEGQRKNCRNCGAKLTLKESLIVELPEVPIVHKNKANKLAGLIDKEGKGEPAKKKKDKPAKKKKS